MCQPNHDFMALHSPQYLKILTQICCTGWGLSVEFSHHFMSFKIILFSFSEAVRRFYLRSAIILWFCNRKERLFLIPYPFFLAWNFKRKPEKGVLYLLLLYYHLFMLEDFFHSILRIKHRVWCILGKHSKIVPRQINTFINIILLWEKYGMRNIL